MNFQDPVLSYGIISLQWNKSNLWSTIFITLADLRPTSAYFRTFSTTKRISLSTRELPWYFLPCHLGDLCLEGTAYPYLSPAIQKMAFAYPITNPFWSAVFVEFGLLGPWPHLILCLRSINDDDIPCFGNFQAVLMDYQSIRFLDSAMALHHGFLLSERWELCLYSQ